MQTSRSLFLGKLLFPFLIASNAFAIVGGSLVKADSPLVKQVVLVLGTTQTGGRGYCTGIVIEKDIVLTAAHCMDPAIKKFYVIPHVDISPESGYDRVRDSIEVTKWITKSNYRDEGNEQANDLALLKLAKPVPSDYQIMPLYDGKSEVSSAYATLAGYGLTKETYIDQGYLRSTTKHLKDIRVMHADEKGKSQEGIMILAEGQDKGACEGDSGGPVFFEVDGKLQVAGVISTTLGDDILTRCHGITVAMYVPYFIPWIQETKALLSK